MGRQRAGAKSPVSLCKNKKQSPGLVRFFLAKKTHVPLAYMPGPSPAPTPDSRVGGIREEGGLASVWTPRNQYPSKPRKFTSRSQQKWHDQKDTGAPSNDNGLPRSFVCFLPMDSLLRGRSSFFSSFSSLKARRQKEKKKGNRKKRNIPWYPVFHPTRFRTV